MYASYLTENVWNHNNTSLNDAQGKITLIIQNHASMTLFKVAARLKFQQQEQFEYLKKDASI